MDETPSERGAVTPAQAGPAPWCADLVEVIAHIVRGRHPMAYAAYRDGEWRAILGYPGANVDGTEYHPELGAALAKTLIEPKAVFRGFWPEGDVGADVRERAVAWRNRHAPTVRFFFDCPIRRANELGYAAPLFSAVRSHGEVTVVGPAHLEALPEELLGPFRHVVVPPGTAWRSVDRTLTEIGEPRGVILFAAGMASNLMIHRLVGPSAALLDVGAILDPYAGVHSRRYMRDARWRAEVMPRNLA